MMSIKDSNNPGEWMVFVEITWKVIGASKSFDTP